MHHGFNSHVRRYYSQFHSQQYYFSLVVHRWLFWCLLDGGKKIRWKTKTDKTPRYLEAVFVDGRAGVRDALERVHRSARDGGVADAAGQLARLDAHPRRRVGRHGVQRDDGLVRRTDEDRDQRANRPPPPTRRRCHVVCRGVRLPGKDTTTISVGRPCADAATSRGFSAGTRAWSEDGRRRDLHRRVRFETGKNVTTKTFPKRARWPALQERCSDSTAVPVSDRPPGR